ncbi:MAG: hypothetical protein V4592_17835 [Bacteroidota bacterium]
MYSYIYIDDTLENIEEGTINGIKHGGELAVHFLEPGLWEQRISELTNIINQHSGLIVDLKLNERANKEGVKAQYRGSTVASELRTLIKEKTIQADIPIFLISADEKLEESLDKTSYDLFDGVISKNTLGDEHGLTYPEFKKLLIAFAESYLKLSEGKALTFILKRDDLTALDNRLIQEMEKLIPFPNHVFMRFLNRQILRKSTVLVSELTLAARLGIDKSSEGWNSFREEHLDPFKYKGLLSTYFNRWWWPDVESWWVEIYGEDPALRMLGAGARVALLKDKFGDLKLQVQQKSEKSKSDKFWTICKGRHIPIDTIDGFLIANQDNSYPWQDKEYISNDEALRPKNIEAWKDIATIEKNRLQKLKDFHGKTEQRVRR